MILKVPIYVEFETVEQELIPEIVQSLQINYYRILRMERTKKLLDASTGLSGFKIPEHRIISREQALKSLIKKV